MTRYCIIGAGPAGLAAAITLAPAANLVLFEAGKIAGGRARRVPLDGMALDNGQHILIGAYSELTRLLRLTGCSPKQLAHLPLSLPSLVAVVLFSFLTSWNKLKRWVKHFLITDNLGRIDPPTPQGGLLN
mgnify:CR=1 FL=1